MWISPLNHNSCNQGNRIPIAIYPLPFLKYLYIISGSSSSEDYNLLIYIFFSVPLHNCPSSCHPSCSFVLGPPPHFCVFSPLEQAKGPTPYAEFLIDCRKSWTCNPWFMKLLFSLLGTLFQMQEIDAASSCM